MQRRNFLTTGAALGGVILGPAFVRQSSGATNRIQQLVFDSTASLLNAEQQPLTAESLVAVWAERTAFNVDEDGDGNAVNYPDSVPIPLVASDGGIIGFGAPLVQDDTRFRRDGNEEFVLNILDAEVGGGTVLFDEGHGQYYDTGKFSAFIGYAEANGYTIEATTNLAADLNGAQAAIITSPSETFTDSQLTALGRFVAAGGSLLLFSQSDFGDYDATTNLNEIATAVNADFRFNDDQVLDPENNVGPNYIPVTDEFNTAFSYFAERPGLGFELDPTKTYTVDVIDVADGDTIDIRFANGSEDTIRMLGIDSPETASRFERPEEWEGLESLDYLRERGFMAEEYAIDQLAGRTVEISFDPNEPLRDVYGRLLAYVAVEGTLYNQQVIADGHARVYDSGLTLHDEFRAVEIEARTAKRGLWSKSDPKNTTEIRDRPVEEVFVPRTASICTTDGRVDDDRVPVFAADSAVQESANNGVEYNTNIPLVAVDETAGLGFVGGPLIDEQYEKAEGFPVDTSGYENFVLLTNLIEYLTNDEDNEETEEDDDPFDDEFPFGDDDPFDDDFPFGDNDPFDDDFPFGNGSPFGDEDERESDDESDNDGDDDEQELTAGLVLIDGGHGQFGAPYALSAEDAAYYKRYLEGQGTNSYIGFEQYNTLTREHLAGAQAFIVTTPTIAFTPDEIDVCREFAADGGTIVLIGSGVAPAAARANLNDLAAGLGTDLRLNSDRVLDRTHNLNSNPVLPVTSEFNDDFSLFGPYTSDSGSNPPVPDKGVLSVVRVHENAAGTERENLNDEYVVFENTGGRQLDVTGWSVQDEVGHRYTFPTGFALDPGTQVTLHTGEGTDTDRDLYWDAGAPIWNNGGDTVIVTNDEGDRVIEKRY